MVEASTRGFLAKRNDPQNYTNEHEMGLVFFECFRESTSTKKAGLELNPTRHFSFCLKGPVA
jgi:hypothetical protein